jgi:hypothetical protein
VTRLTWVPFGFKGEESPGRSADIEVAPEHDPAVLPWRGRVPDLGGMREPADESVTDLVALARISNSRGRLS